ncbi:MAG TPA: sigma-54 dependent transcriptional regulator [bacterium]|nr:sigma-54 dependent transcriptional regulator [bacterium]
MVGEAKGRILVIDDDRDIRKILRTILEYDGYTVLEAVDGREGLARVRDEWPDAVLLDIKMAGLDGVEVLRHIRDTDPDIPVVMLSGHGTVATAIETTKLGAFDFLEKPPDRDKILVIIRNAVANRRLAREKLALERTLTKGFTLVGESPAIKELAATISRVGPTDAKVLITGENGVGKGVVARAIHRESRRGAARFVEVSCAAIPDDLIESELLGYEKGAFSGALARKPGRFELADGGTIFLDEIGDMSPRVQAKVLRVLESGEFERVGGTETVKVDVRLIAATNQDIKAMIKSGTFREDLYYRLNVVVIDVPPLRKRREDIPILARYFLNVYCELYGLRPKLVDDGLVQELTAYAWPGNVRELRNIVERMVITSRRDTLTREDLPPLTEVAGELASELAGTETYEEFRRISEKRFLTARLRANKWNISKTAQELGMQRGNLYIKMKKLGIEPDERT